MYNPFGQLVKEKSFTLLATVPFYKNSVFSISIVSLVLVFCILFMLYFRRSINIKTETKAKIAMDLHDESGTILTRLLLITKKEKMEAINKEQVQNGLKELSYSLRTYVDSISNKKHTFQELIDDIKEFTNYTCSFSGITPIININFDNNHILKDDLYRDIKLTIYEIINNSLKHSNADKISLLFVLKKRKLEIIVSDNGKCNISDLNTMKGNGIRNIKRRITRNNGKISYFIPKGKSGLTIEINLTI
jgi:signal transduction histidine kinase